MHFDTSISFATVPVTAYAKCFGEPQTFERDEFKTAFATFAPLLAGLQAIDGVTVWGEPGLARRTPTGTPAWLRWHRRIPRAPPRNSSAA